jgi:hypothetical protein
VFLSGFLARPFSSQGLLDPSLFPGFQVKGVPFDFFDDVFLLNLALEAAESALDRLAFLNLDFSHALKHPLTPLVAPCNDL